MSLGWWRGLVGRRCSVPVIKVAPVEGGCFDTTQDVDGLLRRAYPGDAGFDLFCQGEHQIAPGASLDIPLGVRVQLPEGWWGLLTGRSSALRKRGLVVVQAVIDQGYRGPLYACVQNTTGRVVVVKHGERLAQLVPLPLFPGWVVPVQELDGHGRGTNGFGSSGL